MVKTPSQRPEAIADQQSATSTQKTSSIPAPERKAAGTLLDDTENTDMVAAGYIHEDDNDNRDLPRRGNSYYGSSSRSASRDSKPRTEWRRRCDQPQLSADEMLDGGCTRHTYLDKDGIRRPAHILIVCREFLRLSRVLQERMQTEQPVAGAVAYNAPPPSPNPPANVVHNYHNSLLAKPPQLPQQTGTRTVLRLKQTSTSKLEPPWEGPYLVHEAIPGGAYRLRDPKTGKDIDNPWNAQQLRRFYP
jgi:hypothetical protein